ncbi:tRNA methyltransferase 10 homolog A [Tribolium castaneum]|uniref:tRNA (guanine(9)-N(1))-methyltransferase n=1 Tax=Tribolium castaneum TaxID=7070 RepID=D6X1A5_TRICA|nr:PREDICTED: tRNA methyltransferase 10 homolog A [Tribolium castaneum]EFA10600.1 tRNA methyltransferase 10 homolog A-like Protein [Tribolium castaneum]|eukprot:XP_972690.1 PREDICTED: tRNA methyltransferase 10 homolog A [Tribolium castaneum]
MSACDDTTRTPPPNPDVIPAKKIACAPKLFNGVEISQLTKRQMKKYQKCLKWQQVKKEKRAKERLKSKEKRIQAKLNNVDLGPSRKQLKRMKMKDSPCKITVCIDLSFDDLMIDKDMAKTIKQILRIYTENRRAQAPMQLYLTSFNGRSKTEMEKHHGFENWDLNFCPQDYLDIFTKEKLVYLSSESDKVITELQQDKVYIIGGLVDHNFHKGICYKKALEQGIDHGQLPISEYFWLNHRKVLTINQVFEILLRVSEGKTFKAAFEMILPKRIEKISAQDSSEEEQNDTTCDNK